MTQQILMLLAGLALFLYGTFQLSASVQRLFNVRIRENIRHSVKKPIYGVILGFIATILAQSSAATTILAVGMVSAGLISFYHSLGLLLGANIGTTLTAQLVVFKVTTLSPIFIVIGAFLWLFAKEKGKIFGEIIFCFGLLFFGLNLAGDSMSPFKDSPLFIELVRQTKNPLIGILIGVVFTLIVQASAIPIGILIILAGQGAVGLESAFPIVLGANISSTVDAVLASFSANIHGKKVALAHVLIKCLGVIIILPFLKPFIAFLKILTTNVPQQIAFSHIFFNLIIAAVFLILLKPFSRLVEKILDGQADVLPLWPEWLNDKYLQQPKIALDAVVKELKRMLMIAQRIISLSKSLVFDFKKSAMSDTAYTEFVVDNLQGEIAKFLDKISEIKLTQKEAGRLLHFAAMVDDIERIADQGTNIAKLSRHKTKYGVPFSPEAEKELHKLYELINSSLNDTISLIEKYDLSKAQDVLRREERVDQAVHDSKEKHFQRFFDHVCKAEAGPIFVDILVNLERISDHCVNIVEDLAEISEKYS